MDAVTSYVRTCFKATSLRRSGWYRKWHESRRVQKDYKDCCVVLNASKRLQSVNELRHDQQGPQFRHGWGVHNVAASCRVAETKSEIQLLRVVQKWHSVARHVRTASLSSELKRICAGLRLCHGLWWIWCVKIANCNCLVHSHTACVTIFLSRIVLWSYLPTRLSVQEHFAHSA
jgi:hypothetical protein